MAMDGMSVPIDVFVDADIRSHLQIRNQERKVRMHLDREVEVQDVSISMVREMIERRISALDNQPYGLSYRITTTNPDGHNNYNPMARPKPLLSDKDMSSALTQVLHDLETMEKSGMGGGKGSIQIYVDALRSLQQKEAICKPYLQGMADPNLAETMTMISFYQFYGINEVSSMVETLAALWKPFKALGRVYVAPEGINGQMAVPSNVVDTFYEACRSEPVFADPSSFFYFNTDHEMTMDEYEATQPFKALHIRERSQILADGLDVPLDWRESGTLLDAEEWHMRLDNPDAVVLDCRNSYESDVGTFQGAIPLNTTFFRESWTALDKALKGVPKDKPIMTFCTGGIRCVKINAYLHQKLGYQDVSRLKGGIIAYAKAIGDGDTPVATTTSTATAATTINNYAEGGEAAIEIISAGKGTLNEKSKFRGVNYVFDERMGAKITDDLLAVCESCGVPCGTYTNCGGDSCHVRFIQCPNCQIAYSGCCSESCRLEAMRAGTSSINNKKNGDVKTGQRAMRPRASTVTSTITSTSPATSSTTCAVSIGKGLFEVADAHAEDLARYCEAHSAQESALARALRQETAEKYADSPGAARMISGHLQGSFLSMLVQMTSATSVLELGCFTGYSALSFAEGMKATGTVSKNTGTVLSCDVDKDAASVAQRYFTEFNEQAGRDVISLELRSAGEVLQAARQAGSQFDIVFIDADKMAYRGYLEELITPTSGTTLLREGGLVIVDNTLWKGLVLQLQQQQQMSSSSSASVFEPTGPTRSPSDFGKEERMVKLATAMHEFNAFVSTHPQLSQVMLPFRDGLSVIRFSVKQQQE
jgi:predicted sulfurtransferase/predicted O-methyltransferase YrrM